MPQTFVNRLQVSDSGFVFDTQTGSTFSLNPTAVTLVRLLKEGHDQDQLVESLVQEYGIDAPSARRDVEDFVVSLREFGKL